MSRESKLCCLCGAPGTSKDLITREHVPPKQFYPKSLRDGLNLWVVPTHRRCNESYREHEEYFYCSLAALAIQQNPGMHKELMDDLERRAKKPQTRVLLRSILRTARARTSGGVLLPPGIVCLEPDTFRLQQVAIKIGRCLFYRDHGKYMPYENCVDIRLCEREGDAPAMYQLSWQLSKIDIDRLAPKTESAVIVIENPEAGSPSAACRRVFDYRQAFIEREGAYLYTLRFWEAFLMCMAFRSPAAIEAA